MSEFLRDIPDVERNESEKRMILDKLKVLLSDWQDEIPEEIVDSGDAKIKARTRWFTNIVNYLYLAKEYGFLKGNLLAEADDFINRHTLPDGGFKKRGRTTPQQIEEGNDILVKIVAELEKQPEEKIAA